jgi:hypothetical protein
MGNPNKMASVSAESWGAQVDYASWPPVAGRDGTTVHYTGTSGTQKNILAADDPLWAEQALLRDIEEAHLGKGWSGIGYSHAVGPSGILYVLRGDASGAHNPGDSDGDGVSDNKDSYGLLLMVGPGETPTGKMWTKTCEYLDVVGGTIKGHGESRGTACPGDIVQDMVDSYKSGDRPDAPDDTPPTSTNWTNTMIENLPARKKRSDLGKTSDWDRKIQGLLAAAGYLDIQSNLDGKKFDGKFGASTEKAVKSFQSSNSLSSDGIVGKNTWEGLIA